MPATYINYANNDDYTDDTWTALVSASGIVSNVLLSNIGGGSISVELRVYDTDASATVWQSPVRVLEIGDLDALDKGIALGADETLEFRASDAGLSIMASVVNG
jgi:hypothetical protein